MADKDVEIKLVPKGIKVVVNPADCSEIRRPNVIQTSFSELFSYIDLIRLNVHKQSRKFQALNKIIFRKLNM